MKNYLAILCFFLSPLFSYSWSAPGHEMGGAIAYWYLKANKPDAIPKIVAILENHPWFLKAWTPRLEGFSKEQKDIGLFMLASIFPDEARRTNYGSGEKSKWHYINYPVNPKNIPVPEMVVPNGEQKLKELLETISKQKSLEEKAIDLCWIFHILQDLHQPLHTAALFDAVHRSGDKGGNETYFNYKDEGRPIRLHSFWDGLIKGSFDSIPEMAKKLVDSPKYYLDQLPELKANPEISDWVKNESLELARTKAYLDGTLNGTEDSASLVPENYKTDSETIAERRIVLCGIRLGQRMAAIF